MSANNNEGLRAIPDWKLERYLLGELPEREFEAIRELEASDGALRGRIDALRADGAEILAAYPPERMAGRIKSSVGKSNRAFGKTNFADSRPNSADSKTTLADGRSNLADSKSYPISRKPPRFRARDMTARIRMFAIPAAACAALLVALPVGMQSFKSTGKPPLGLGHRYEDRAKGAGPAAPAIEVWRKEGGAARRLAPSSAAKDGDIVQLRYAVPEFCYGALVSMDGRGVLTVHLSGESGKAAPLTPGKPVALAASYQLDDAPLFEVFYLITASENFDMDSVTRPLQNARHPIDKWDDPSQTKLTAFVLRKSQDEARR
jgi:hypothetical protein